MTYHTHEMMCASPPSTRVVSYVRVNSKLQIQIEPTFGYSAASPQSGSTRCLSSGVLSGQWRRGLLIVAVAAQAGRRGHPRIRIHHSDSRKCSLSSDNRLIDLEERGYLSD